MTWERVRWNDHPNTIQLTKSDKKFRVFLYTRRWHTVSSVKQRHDRERPCFGFRRKLPPQRWSPPDPKIGNLFLCVPIDRIQHSIRHLHRIRAQTDPWKCWESLGEGTKNLLMNACDKTLTSKVRNGLENISEDCKVWKKNARTPRRFNLTVCYDVCHLNHTLYS